ncbi:hypothetical protein NPIL_607141 [Nephila pilipes]|uniref:Uncharacterized protein n=1 Tax=Nephila pilipes TaxID=299642 RepID=A0A8X6IUV7_NEPPI|nr:hypothetical protein NPIL_607141 [Nephila pilipes]
MSNDKRHRTLSPSGWWILQRTAFDSSLLDLAEPKNARGSSQQFPSFVKCLCHRCEMQALTIGRMDLGLSCFSVEFRFETWVKEGVVSPITDNLFGVYLLEERS